MPKERIKPPPYACPSCGFESRLKGDIKRHFYQTKKPCANLNGVVLTENMKEQVLLYRIYHHEQTKELGKSKEPKQNIIKITNFNLHNISLQDKLERFTKYQKSSLIDYQTKVQELYEEKTDKMEFCTSYDDIVFELQEDDFIDIIDKTCTVNMASFEDFNIFYNTDLDYITLFDNGEWKNVLYKRGIREMISIIQAAYLNVYEKYLIRRVTFTKHLRLKQHCEELLQEYYRFLAILDLQPYVNGKCDDDILDDGRYDSYIETDYFYSIYKTSKSNLRVTQQKHLITSILKIIHKHSRKNISKFDTTLSVAASNDKDLLACLQNIKNEL